MREREFGGMQAQGWPVRRMQQEVRVVYAEQTLELWEQQLTVNTGRHMLLAVRDHSIHGAGMKEGFV
jgi:hypothetical protein